MRPCQYPAADPVLTLITQMPTYVHYPRNIRKHKISRKKDISTPSLIYNVCVNVSFGFFPLWMSKESVGKINVYSLSSFSRAFSVRDRHISMVLKGEGGLAGSGGKRKSRGGKEKKVVD